MVEKKLIQDTIIELMDANVDKDTIFSTLKEIGVGEDDIETNYTEIISQRNESVKESSQENFKEDDKKKEIENKEKEDIIDEKESATKKSIFDDISENKKTTKTDFLEKNKSIDSEKLEEDFKETTEKVNKINDNFIEKKQTIINNSSNNLQLDEIEKDIKEIKAQINGLTKIMKDILNENRNILNKL